jgi:hypothetical protein
MCRSEEQGPMSRDATAEAHMSTRIHRHIVARFGVASIGEVDGTCSALRVLGEGPQRLG